jgi:hypothetical protein
MVAFKGVFHMNNFKDSSNTMVITLNEILIGLRTVLYVSHDKEDGIWQFLDRAGNLDTDNARILSLNEILQIDSTLSILGDLPLGWVAERNDEDSIWTRKEKR